MHIYYAYNKQWDSYLHVLQHNYNRSVNSSIRFSPFQALFGYQPLACI
jgi:hypothetical protein